MWYRLVSVAGLVLAAGLAPAQQGNVYSKAVPPSPSALERLNLRAEWTLVVPVEGTRDTITQVQTFGDQIFVQTRTGSLVVVDALTGRIQWAARLGSGSYGNSYPVAVNSQFVFCAHITKLYAFYRYTGVTEFVTELGTPPTAGLAADEEAVYCVLGMRSGSAGAHRVAVYDLPRPVTVGDPAKALADPLAQGATKGAAGPLAELMNRYSPGAFAPTDDIPELIPRPAALQAPTGGYTGSRTPSLSVLPSVVPPYALDNRAPAPALGTLPSLRHPYHLRLESGKYIQQTPSLGVIPPSVAASLLLADLRPKAVAPPLRWEYGLTSRLLYPLVLTPTRVWGTTDDNTVLALNKEMYKGKVSVEVRERLSSPVAAPAVAAGTTQYVPMGNGNVIAIESTTGDVSGGLNVKWRTDTAGLNNRSPFVSKDRVYAAGANSGVTCLDRETGDVLWRSDSGADQVIGANEEFVYIRDRQGRFLVYDARRPTDTARKRSRALGSADFSEFNINIVNTASDRVYLAADNGLIVCLRDAKAKYAKPMSLWPAPVVNRARATGVDALNKDGPPAGPKKDPDPMKN
ncbi:MAG TPA: PQQ-binding-like beta-propeller repeat protein [Gemmata sp.]